MVRVLHGECVQVELLLHLGQFVRLRVVERDPDQAIRTAHVLAYVFLLDVADFFAVLIGDAADQHVPLLLSSMK